MKKRYARILAATLSAAMVFTSAPTAVFATELSVSEDVVEAEGETEEQLAAMFPEVKAIAGQNDLYYKNGSSWSKFSSLTRTIDSKACNLSYSVAGNKQLVTMVPGQSVDGTLKIDVSSVVASNSDYFTGYESATGFSYVASEKALVKNVKITCALDDITYNAAKLDEMVDAGVDATDAVTPSKLTYYYGDDKITAETSVGTPASNDYFASANVADVWKFVSIDPALKTAKAEDKFAKGAKFVYKDEIDGAVYDTAAIVKYLNETASTKTWATGLDVVYSYADKKLYAEVAVTPEKKEITADEVVWPTLPTLTYGDVIADIKLPEGCGGEFKVTKVYSNYDLDATDYVSGGKIDNTGVAYVQVEYTVKDANIKAKNVDSEDGTVKATVTGFTKVFKTTIAKKVVPADKVKLILKKTEFDFGTDYDALDVGAITTLAQDNTYVNFDLDTTKKYTGSEILAPGRHEIEYTVSLKDPKTVFADGTTEDKTIKQAITIKDPGLKVSLTDGGDPLANTIDIAKGDSSNEAVAKILYNGSSDFLTDFTAKLNVSYQWYAIDSTGSKKAVTGATTDTFDIPATDVGTTKYYCEMSVEPKNSLLSTNERVLFNAILGNGKFTTATIEVNVADKIVTVNTITAKYGTETTITATTTETYKDDTVSAYIIDEKGAKTSLNVVATFSTGTYTFTAKVPATVKPGVYTFVTEAKIVDGTETKTIRGSKTFEIEKGYLKAEGIVTTLGNSANAKVSLVNDTIIYGTKTSDIKLSYNNEYGTFKVTNADEYLTPNASPVAITVEFIPSAATAEVYDGLYIGGVNKKFDVVGDLSAGNIKVEKAVLTVKATPVTMKVGDKLVDASATLEGFVAGETTDSWAVKAIAEYAEGTAEKVKVAGEYKDVVIPKLVAHLGGAYPAGLDNNYTVKYVNASVVVKEAAAPTTPPTVAPTPAPVKQATAAAPKAAKAKATVKVGKKYTLKLKYAAGKKATVKKIKWTSSKKSVATVSSKGKVTAKKAGKATIYARVYFKDGSMKKIKFTVTVK